MSTPFTVLFYGNIEIPEACRDWKPVANGQLSHFVFGKYSAAQLGKLSIHIHTVQNKQAQY